MAHPQIDLPRPIEFYHLFLLFMAGAGSVVAIYNLSDWRAVSWWVLVCSGLWLAWMLMLCWEQWTRFYRDVKQFGLSPTVLRHMARLSRRQVLYVNDDHILIHAGRVGSRVLCIEQMPIEDIVSVEDHSGQASAMGVQNAKDYFISINMADDWRGWKSELSYYSLYLNLSRHQAHELVLNIELLVRA